MDARDGSDCRECSCIQCNWIPTGNGILRGAYVRLLYLWMLLCLYYHELMLCVHLVFSQAACLCARSVENRWKPWRRVSASSSLVSNKPLGSTQHASSRGFGAIKTIIGSKLPIMDPRMLWIIYHTICLKPTHRSQEKGVVDA